MEEPGKFLENPIINSVSINDYNIIKHIFLGKKVTANSVPLKVVNFANNDILNMH